MRRTSLTAIILALLLISGAWVHLYPKWQRFRAIDQCLNSGGRWDYAADRCEYCYNADGTFVGGPNCNELPPDVAP